MPRRPTRRSSIKLPALLLLTMVVGLLTCWLPAQGRAATHVLPDHDPPATSPGEPGHVGACDTEAIGMPVRAWLPASSPATPAEISPLSPHWSRQLPDASEPGRRAGTLPLFLLHAALLI